MARLGENASFIMGQAPASSACNTDGIGTPFVKAGQFGESFPIIDEWTTNPLKIAKESDVLICVVGATSGKLNRGIDCAIGRSVAAIRPHENVIRDYIYYGLHPWIQRLRSGSQGSAIGVITKDMLESVMLPFPNVERQQRIVQTLSLIEGTIKKRTDELQKLDYLIKARFVEMFSGESNMMKMSNVCSIITDGTHQPPKFVTEGIPFIFVSNVVNDKLTYDAEKFITQETYDELIKRTPIEIGDVLLSTVGSYGHPAVVESDTKFLFQRHIAYLKPKKEIIDSHYLHGALLSPESQRQIEEGVKGIAQKTLNLSEIKKMVIPVPDLSRQKQFSGFVKQVDKSKSAVKKSLDEAQLLFDSLMQKYFG